MGDIEIVHVPYSGSAAAITDLLAVLGATPLLCTSVSCRHRSGGTPRSFLLPPNFNDLLLLERMEYAKRFAYRLNYRYCIAFPRGGL